MDLYPGGFPDRDPRTVKSGQYASYWNAFLSSLQSPNTDVGGDEEDDTVFLRAMTRKFGASGDGTETKKLMKQALGVMSSRGEHAKTWFKYKMLLAQHDEGSSKLSSIVIDN